MPTRSSQRHHLQEIALQPYDSTGWIGFFSAPAEVAATLTVFIFVAISINLTRSVATPGLTQRAVGELGELIDALIRHHDHVRRSRAVDLPTVRDFVGGLSMTIKARGGLYSISSGIIFAMMVGVSNAWALMVEILR